MTLASRLVTILLSSSILPLVLGDSSSLFTSEAEKDEDLQQLYHLEESGDFTGRVGTVSECLHLNIRNLLFWLGLKALALALWFLRPQEKKYEHYDSYGGGYGGRKKRSLDDIHGVFMSPIEEEGATCFMAYGPQNPEGLTCLKKLACQNPELGLEYAEAAKMAHAASVLTRYSYTSVGYK